MTDLIVQGTIRADCYRLQRGKELKASMWRCGSIADLLLMLLMPVVRGSNRLPSIRLINEVRETIVELVAASGWQNRQSLSGSKMDRWTDSRAHPFFLLWRLPKLYLTKSSVVLLKFNLFFRVLWRFRCSPPFYISDTFQHFLFAS